MAENRAKYAEILEQILTNDISFSLFKNDLDEKEKGFVNMLFMTTFRQLTFIQTEVLPQFVKRKIANKQKILEYLLVLGSTELLFMNTPDYAVINSYVEVAKSKTDKFGGNFVNAVLRNISRQKERLFKERKAGYFSKKFIQILKQDYTAEEIKQMEEFVDIEAPLDLTLKHNFSQNFCDVIVLPTGSLRFPANTKIPALSGYNEGNWWVQDAGSALAVKALSYIKGKRVLDLCAAPGGKTAQLIDAGAYVTAVDISEERLAILRENMERLKFTKNLETICSDALNFSSDKKFDIILIDAPCSATGTFRRHPEILHTKTLDDVKKQSLLQQKILEQSVSLLAPHGLLLYATCSLAKAEGEMQIHQFLKKHDNFDIIPLTQMNLPQMLTKDGFLRVLPYHFKEFFGIDGFFIACLQRKN